MEPKRPRGLFLCCTIFILMHVLAQGNEPKVALIFGITGQDGAYLTEFLLKKNYIVHGVRRISSLPNTGRLDKILNEVTPVQRQRFFLHHGDVTDSLSIVRILQETEPDEIYHLAAQSHVWLSFDLPEYTGNVGALGTIRLLEAIHRLGWEKKVKFYHAATSEMFGKVQEIPQRETTPFYPRSPYACAKVYSFWVTKNYREAYGLFACNGILFNHESPLRGEAFVTRKITLGACRYKLGMQKLLTLGNLDARRDWGFARDYVEAMWLMLQQPSPDDYVIATGESHSVREFVEQAYRLVGVEVLWQGDGIDEKGIDSATGEVIIAIDPACYRPTEVDYLLGDASKAAAQLPWKPKTSFSELLKIMVEADWNELTSNR